MPKGFVYVLTNAAMPNLVKIGFSLKMPTERAAELSSTGVPGSFEVEYYCLVEDPAGLESRVHADLAPKRHSADREFFRISVTEAITSIARRAPSPEHAWSRIPLARARPDRVACAKCGAYYVSAEYCPKCRVRLQW